MPTYRYRCENCKNEIEQYQKINDPNIRKCPSCNKNSLNRIPFVTNLSFQGSGFYVNDYKNK